MKLIYVNLDNCWAILPIYANSLLSNKPMNSYEVILNYHVLIRSKSNSIENMRYSRI